MPRKRLLRPNELGMLQIFEKIRPHVNSIERALNTGQRVEVEETIAGDPGAKSCAIIINGVELVRIRGF